MTFEGSVIAFAVVLILIGIGCFFFWMVMSIWRELPTQILPVILHGFCPKTGDLLPPCKPRYNRTYWMLVKVRAGTIHNVVDQTIYWFDADANFQADRFLGAQQWKVVKDSPGKIMIWSHAGNSICSLQTDHPVSM